MKISESEMEIMKIIWDKGTAVTTADIFEKLATPKKQTTVLTFLKRLADKGVLHVRREGKTNFYTPIISEKTYKKQRTDEFLNEMYSGSVKNFLAALYDDEKPDEKDMDEIKKWFEEA